jgi:hypothetical protein
MKTRVKESDIEVRKSKSASTKADRNIENDVNKISHGEQTGQSKS